MRIKVYKLVQRAHYLKYDEDGNVVGEGVADLSQLYYPLLQGTENYIKAVESQEGTESK